MKEIQVSISWSRHPFLLGLMDAANTLCLAAYWSFIGYNYIGNHKEQQSRKIQTDIALCNLILFGANLTFGTQIK